MHTMADKLAAAGVKRNDPKRRSLTREELEKYEAIACTEATAALEAELHRLWLEVPS